MLQPVAQLPRVEPGLHVDARGQDIGADQDFWECK